MEISVTQTSNREIRITNRMMSPSTAVDLELPLINKNKTLIQTEF